MESRSREMRNLFDYATKELSQDAFLLWLFANYDDPEIGCISKELMATMICICGDYNVVADDITNVEVHSQSEKMDIIVDFKVNGEQCILIIEDKTTSLEHSDQLKKYKDIVLNKWNVNEKRNRKSFFVFYKTHRINSDERDRIKNAGWNEFSFDQIKDFWEKYQDCSNIIISQYSKHVLERWEDSKNIAKPSDNNVDKWIGFFEQTVKPSIKTSCDIWVSSTFYGYAYLCARPKGDGDEPIPYLEIRSRDCLDNNFQARILMYDVETKYLTPIRDIIKSNEHKGIFKGDYGAKKNKQVAHTFRNELFKANGENEFIDKINYVIDEYLNIIDALKRVAQ